MQSQFKIINQISIFLLLLFPCFLVTGPFLSELAMNLINIFFLYKIFTKKKFKYFKNKFFVFFILFYFYIFINIFLSEYLNEIIFKHFFYFRFVLFVFAIVDLLNENKNLLLLFYKTLTITILVISLDGIIQFFFGYNSLGFEKIRVDRLTGFFHDKMIIGSFLSRLFPLMVGLLIYNFKNLSKIFLNLGLITILISSFTILLSGERMAFYTNIIFILGILFFLNLSNKIKISLFSVIFIIISLSITISPTLLDRYFNQTKDQILLDFKNKNFFSNFVFYEAIFQTAYNGYLDKKYIGQGARSYRLFCSEENLVTKIIHNADFDFQENKKKQIIIKSINIKSGEFVPKGEVLFTFSLNGIQKEVSFKRNLKINKFNLDNGDINKKISADKIILNYDEITNGCTTHPHNFYLQLLSETGLIGCFFLIIIFLYLIFILLKNFLFYVIKKKNFLSNAQICLLIGFIISLLPIIPNGNFFNNWLNMIMFLPIGFYIKLSKVI